MDCSPPRRAVALSTKSTVPNAGDVTNRRATSPLPISIPHSGGAPWAEYSSQQRSRTCEAAGGAEATSQSSSAPLPASTALANNAKHATTIGVAAREITVFPRPAEVGRGSGNQLPNQLTCSPWVGNINIKGSGNLPYRGV